MLKRPKEKIWHYPEIPEPYPKIPGANGLLLAPSGRGKTTTWIAMLLGPYRGKFARIFVFSPNINIDSAFDDLKDYVSKDMGVDQDREKTFFDSWDEAALEKIIATQHKLIRYEKDKKFKKLHAVLIVIDDWADRPDIMHRAGNLMTSLFIKGRHAGINTWVCSQALKSVHPVCRANFRFVICWKLNDAKQRDAILESFSAIAPLSTLRQMYDQATSGKHDFWYIDLVSPDGVAFYKGFDEEFILD